MKAISSGSARPLVNDTTKDGKLEPCERIFPHLDFAYAKRGIYYPGIQAYQKAFGKENVLIVVQEDLLEDPQGVLNRVFHHLGLRKTKIKPGLWNTRDCGTDSSDVKLSPGCIQKMKSLYAESNQLLISTCGIENAKHWCK